MYISTATACATVFLASPVHIINRKNKILLRGAKQGEDYVDVLIRFISGHLTLLHLTVISLY